MRVLISGASGYIGSKLISELGDSHDVIGTYNTNPIFGELHQMDITDKSAVKSTMSDFQPEMIIHSAAIASLSQCLENPSLAYTVNVKGTKHIIESANNCGARVVYISSLAAIDSESVYGKTKLEGEWEVESATAGYDIVRPSMTYGYSPNTTNDRPFNEIISTLQTGNPYQYDDSWPFQPTYLKHLSDIILQILTEKPANQATNILIPEFRTKFGVASDILDPFNIQIQPVTERGDRKKPEKLREIDSGFPGWSYDEMVQAIIKEIKLNNLNPT